jgi:hypothetical protein
MSQVPVYDLSVGMSVFPGKGKVTGKLARYGAVAARTGIEMEKSRHVARISSTGLVAVVFV